MSSFYFDQTSYRQVQELLGKVDTALLDARPAWRRILVRWQARATSSFAAAQARANGQSRHQRRKARRGMGEPLVMSGRFKSALIDPAVRDLEPLEAWIGVDLDLEFAGGRLKSDYYGVVNRHFKVWKPLTFNERVDWGQEVVAELRQQVDRAVR